MYTAGLNFQQSDEFGFYGENETTSCTVNEKKICNIVCGKEYNIYDDGNNNFWAIGSNKYGQCALAKRYGFLCGLTPITYFKKKNIKIKKVCASPSGSVTFWITNKNRLYINGCNDSSYNQLGIGVSNHRYFPFLVPNIHNVIDAVAAHRFSVLLCSIRVDMILYNWIRTNTINIPDDIIQLLELYPDNTNTVYSTSYDGPWKELDKFKDVKVIQIVAARSYALLLDADGSVWRISAHTRQPTKHVIFENNVKIKYLACNQCYNLGIDSQNRIYSWSVNRYDKPKLMDAFKYEKIVKILCGYNHYLFGLNMYGQCIKINTDIDDIAFKLPYLFNKNINDCKIKNIYLGYMCTIIIFEENQNIDCLY